MSVKNDFSRKKNQNYCFFIYSVRPIFVYIEAETWQKEWTTNFDVYKILLYDYKPVGAKWATSGELL